ncbi:MAG: cold-shock protein [Pantoea sp.]|uniref:cold-shock protein n=1 Tax=Pantoea sp. TaxID=69393 RepID=UPI00290BD614|nr:cold-shock protein [Pantoea sp.]MDU7838879.1 cold-shock protein [Pantoea sp.]
MAVNNLDRSRWYLGNVLWFGGYNSKTDRENKFGFLSSESGTELFFHKNELNQSNTPTDNAPVLFREGIGKNGKPTAFNVHLLDKPDEETSERLTEYLRDAIEGGIDFARWRYRDCVVNCLTQFFGDSAIRRLATSGIAVTKILPLFYKSRNYNSQFAVLAADESFGSLIAQQISPADMPSSFIDDNIDQFAVWVKNFFEATDCQGAGASPSDIINVLLDHISISAILYLAFYNYISSERILEHRRDDIEIFVRRSFTKNKMDILPFVRDAYQQNFSSREQYHEHPVISPFITAHLIKQKMFRKDFSFVNDIESNAELSSDPEYFILSKLLPLIGRNDEQSVLSIILHEIWQGVLLNKIPVSHPSIFKLFPQCNSLKIRFLNLKLSCEAFHWNAKQPDGTINKKFLCRSKVCHDPQVLADLSQDYSDFTIYDWLAHYGMTYLVAGEPSKRDFPIKLAGYFNRIRELHSRLHCRSCGVLMVPNMKYARIEASVWDAKSKRFVKKPFQAAYRLTVFKCASHSCEQFGIGHYINHCIGYKCSEIIDARDLSEKCAEGRFICASCGSCCTKHQEKFGNVNKGETEQVKYDRLYRDSPFFSS